MMGTRIHKPILLALLCGSVMLHGLTLDDAQKGVFETGHNLLRGLPKDATGDEKESCVWCHIPHESFTTDTQSPQWLGQADADNSFSVYGIEENTSKNQLSGPDVMVRVCLTCHDGINAPNISLFSEASPTTFNPNTTGTKGGTFVHSHPVGVEYIPTSESGIKAGLRPESTLLKEWSGAKTIHDLITDGTVKCTSCHDPHTTNSLFLRTSNRGSALCKGCHDK